MRRVSSCPSASGQCIIDWTAREIEGRFFSAGAPEGPGRGGEKPGGSGVHATDLCDRAINPEWRSLLRQADVGGTNRFEEMGGEKMFTPGF